MKLCHFVAVLAMIIPPVFPYDNIYDKFDVDLIINDDKSFDAYIACLLDKELGPCATESSTEFKHLFGEIVGTACAECNERQADIVKKILFTIMKKRPEKLEEFMNFYDPEEEYAGNFAAFLFDREDGINILDMFMAKHRKGENTETPSLQGYHLLDGNIPAKLLKLPVSPMIPTRK